MSQRILKNWFLPLLILLAFVGGRVADVCDFSDYHQDIQKTHLESSDNSAYDADDPKQKLKIFTSFVPVELKLLLPSTAPVTHQAVTVVCSTVILPFSLPARAPPV